MSHKDSQESIKVTSEYRREASELVASSLTDQGANGLTASLQQCLGRNALASASQEPPSLNIPSSFAYCHACGSVLQPGKNKTTLRLRSVGRGTTRRRRASRRKAAELRSKKQASKGGGQKWKHNHDGQMNGEQEERNLFRVTDGTCRNVVVVTCGSCGWKLKHKGLPPSRQQAVKAKKATKKAPEKPVSLPTNGLGDVVALPHTPAGKVGKKKAGKGPRKAQRPLSSKKAKSSKLLDFLSSLND